MSATCAENTLFSLSFEHDIGTTTLFGGIVGERFFCGHHQPHIPTPAGILKGHVNA
jgi:hypothetical protein